MSLNI